MAIRNEWKQTASAEIRTSCADFISCVALYDVKFPATQNLNTFTESKMSLEFVQECSLQDKHQNQSVQNP